MAPVTNALAGTGGLPFSQRLCSSWKVREGALAASRCILKACGARCVTTCGARCVTTCGARVTRRWCAGAGLRGGHLGARRGPLRRDAGPILLDQGRCSGVQSSLAQCSHAGWLILNCAPGEDASVICSGKWLSFPRVDVSFFSSRFLSFSLTHLVVQSLSRVRLLVTPRTAAGQAPFPVFHHLLEFAQEKAMAPHSSTLVWEIPWTEEPGGLQSMGSQKPKSAFFIALFSHL